MISRQMLSQITWVAGSYGASQGLRLFTNVVLARLLAPQLFGVMLIVNTLRTGIELLSDVGIGQNIVSNRKGDQPDFYNTAWTIQIIRGIFLFAIALLLAQPLASFYDSDELVEIIPIISVVFLLTGIQAPARFILQKRQAVRTIALFDVFIAAVSAIVHIALALYSPTIWALVAGLIVATSISATASFFLIDFRLYRIKISREHVKAIISFGKWVFASSVVFFLAMNFDRLYFAKEIPFAILGIYGIARTFSDMIGMLVQRIGTMMIFPKVAAFAKDRSELRPAIAGLRRKALLATAGGLSIIVALSDVVILTLYDDRYIAAAFMLPILMAGTWFSILSTMGESFMLGIGKSVHSAQANFAKLLWLVIAVPLTLTYYGLIAALCVIAIADLFRYVSLSFSQWKEGLSFLKQDFALLSLFAFLVVIWRYIFMQLGLVADFGTWLEYGSIING
ncbi:oligosaccharide flippase family protein [Parasphingorhabdus cellanae]|uniref:Oligosaccharide flippase family protein n=1 Tax=Parasphingorhabdus cellanae TaxID=2806553 RepID=A0ABX7T3V1_9SPHN|nr:oligosaccharide flippase family protein [Parasphingorhabdus cellanae]QTD56256.1 oligosaccharide flippase family protein [Parasphingorhabdus cellanae]